MYPFNNLRFFTNSLVRRSKFANLTSRMIGSLKRRVVTMTLALIMTSTFNVANKNYVNTCAGNSINALTIAQINL